MSLRNVVFLVTTAFAKWFGADGAFLATALQHIYGNFAYHDNMGSIQSSVAIVDRLPSQARVRDCAEVVSSDGQIKLIHGHQGIALWIDSMRFGPDTLPSLSNDDYVERLVRVTFMRRLGGGTVVELPPANTLFVNGEQNTIFQDTWAINPFTGPRLKQIGPRQPLKTLEIFDEADAPWFSAPIEALTGRREVLSSMGNVIRQVRSGKDGKPAPASAELEEKVPQYLARRRGTDGTLVIVALVFSPRTFEILEPGELIDPSEGALTEAALSSLRRALLEGAHMHRVTSGGGGWGQKQGLLSLDPSFDFSKHEDTGSLGAMLRELGSDRPPNSRNAVSPGDLVQFFASYEPEQPALQHPNIPNTEDIDTSHWDAKKWDQSDSLRTILGSLPSQDDWLMPSQDTKQFASSIIGIPGYFGMLSAGGTCLRRYKLQQSGREPSLHGDEIRGGQGELEQVALSRMDIPYGFWNVQSVNQHLSPRINHVPAAASSGERQSSLPSP